MILECSSWSDLSLLKFLHLAIPATPNAYHLLPLSNQLRVQNLLVYIASFFCSLTIPAIACQGRDLVMDWYCGSASGVSNCWDVLHVCFLPLVKDLRLKERFVQICVHAGQGVYS